VDGGDREAHKKQIRYGSLVSRWKDGALYPSAAVWYNVSYKLQT